MLLVSQEVAMPLELLCCHVPDARPCLRIHLPGCSSGAVGPQARRCLGCASTISLLQGPSILIDQGLKGLLPKGQAGRSSRSQGSAAGSRDPGAARRAVQSVLAPSLLSHAGHSAARDTAVRTPRTGRPSIGDPAAGHESR